MTLIRSIKFFSFIGALLMISACGDSLKRDVTSPLSGASSVGRENLLSGEATVRILSTEGNHAVLEFGANTLIPTNLDDDLQQDGLRVYFEAELLRESVSIYQSGIIVELKKIELVD